jgi:predicted enzyme related to lactoylglutathione lyase
MDSTLKIKVYALTLDCVDAIALGKFYAALLNWEMGFYEDEYAWVYKPGTKQGETPCVMFQQNVDYQPPVWPEEPGAQQQMAHLDIAVDDLESAVRHAVACGATVSKAQFSTNWTVMIDPAGHPFCLCSLAHVFADGE